MISLRQHTFAERDAGATTPVLEAIGITVLRGPGGAPILEDASIVVHPGRVHALVGPNGAGKSTLFAVLAGDTVPAAGSVTLDGQALSRFHPRELARLRAVLLQENRVSFSFLVDTVVRMGRTPWAGTDRDLDDDVVVAACMALTDVTHLRDRPVMSLSGGERARVALARVLAQQAPVMLWDEPTAALDLRHQESVLRLGRERAADGAAVAVVLHDLGAALAYADDVTLLAGGRVIAAGTPSAVLTPERIADVYGQAVDIFDHPVTGLPVLVPRR